jgi:SPP1 gp7 family putative phage head morphogenesis protein
MSQNFDAETVGDLNDTLTAGLQAGEGIDQLSARVSQVYNQAQDYRADRVARTEASSASNGATLDAYQQNPAVTAMTWYANPGACEYCDDLDGTTVGLWQNFVDQGDSVDVEQDDGSTDSYQADYGDIESPPLHPNCACTIVPETD